MSFYEEEAGLSEEFRATQVDALYSDPRSFVIGGIGACSAMLVLAVRNHCDKLAALAAGLVVLTMARLVLTGAYRRACRNGPLQHLRWWEAAYHVGATAYIALVGSIALMTFLVTDATPDRVLAIATAIAYMAGIPGRSFASPIGVIAQVVGCGGPILAAIAVAGGPPWLLIWALLVPFFMGLASLANRLRRVFVDATVRAFDLEVLARRFSTALNNMPHGLAMLDERNRLVVYNQRLLDLIGLDRIGDLHGQSLKTLVEQMNCQIATGVFAKAEAAVVAGEPSANIEFTTDSGRSLALTCQTRANGGAVIVVQDITERRRAEKRIEELALTDSVTGLANRAHLGDRIAGLIGREPAGSFALLFIDLDRFKQVNDTLGHTQGDEVIRIVARRLKELCTGGVVGRFGGDEFIVFQPCTSPSSAEKLGERIVELLSRPYVLAGRNIVVGASVGIALYPDHDCAPDELIRKADAALYRAKRNGRGIISLYSAGLDEEIRSRSAASLELRRALRNDEFEVFYQPIFDMRFQRYTSCEALVRWRHPERGLVGPGEFVHLAEESGLIIELTDIVLRKACRDCTSWPSNVAVAINVSAASFRRGNLVAAISEALRTSQLPSNRLEIELTESILLEDAALAAATMRVLHLSGVRISLDDFGTGYSNLSHLHRLPLHRMKIDRSFLTGLGEDPKAGLMLRGLSRLGAELGLVVLVEGVETQEQLDVLRATCDIDQVQGFFFSRPVPAPEIAALLWAQADHSAARMTA